MSRTDHKTIVEYNPSAVKNIGVGLFETFHDQLCDELQKIVDEGKSSPEVVLGMLFFFSVEIEAALELFFADLPHEHRTKLVAQSILGNLNEFYNLTKDKNE